MMCIAMLRQAYQNMWCCVQGPAHSHKAPLPLTCSRGPPQLPTSALLRTILRTQRLRPPGTDPSMVNAHFLRLGLPADVCKALVNPGFFDPFDPARDITLDNPAYRRAPASIGLLPARPPARACNRSAQPFVLGPCVAIV